MRGTPILWSAAIALAIGSTAAVANVVIVKSLGPSAKAYPPGKTLPPSAKITLQGGDVVTILGPSAAQTMRGPGNFDAGQVSLASAAGQRGRFGALRAAEVAHNPSIWDIDVSKGGRICITNAAQLKLWRPDSESDMTVTIRDENGKEQPLSWSAGAALAAWPNAMPLKSGAAYQVEWPDSGESSSLDVVLVPSAPTDLVGAAQVLMANGCDKQLDLLVESASKVGK